MSWESSRWKIPWRERYNAAANIGNPSADILSQRSTLRIGMKPEKLMKVRESEALVYSLTQAEHRMKA